MAAEGGGGGGRGRAGGEGGGRAAGGDETVADEDSGTRAKAVAVKAAQTMLVEQKEE